MHSASTQYQQEDSSVPRIEIPDLDLDDLDELEEKDFVVFEKFAPTRKDMAPVSGKHNFQRRTEDAINAHRKRKNDSWN
jgi:hypothetical protein